MNISADICQRILNSVPTAPPEIGGILGSMNGIICQCRIDTGCSDGCGCFYSPDVEALNDTIRHWQQRGILFCGIFHTHFFGVKTLSDGDIAYINAILQAMPACISELYFPLVVLPDRQIVPYLATRDGNTVKIKSEELTIV